MTRTAIEENPRSHAALQPMVTRVCPLCGEAETSHVICAGDTIFGCAGIFDVVRCNACGMMYTNPQIAPAHLGRFYPAAYSAHAPDRPIQRHYAPRSRDPWDQLPESGRKRLLDVGCGSGAYLLRQRARGWRCVGVEPSPDAVRAARSYGLDVYEGEIPGLVLTEGPFDVIVLMASLGCMSAPLATLRTLRTMLADGGLLIVSAHNAGSNAARVLGEDWQGWDLPRNLNHFTPDTLRRMIELAGFGPVRIQFRRRTSRWRHAARRRAAATGLLRWRLLASSRQLCSLVATLWSRGERSDEVVALAGQG